MQYSDHYRLRGLIAPILALACVAQLASAQPALPLAAPAPAVSASAMTMPSVTPASEGAMTPVAPAPGVAASPAPVLLPLVKADAAPVAVVVQAPAGCAASTGQAMAADMAALTAQSKKLDLTEQSRLFNEAVSLWTQAQTQCSGHAKERAKRNRDDDLQMLDRVLEKLDAGPQCAGAHKDAASLQDIAKQALSDRRWNEAAALFRKAESMWDYAAERCTGTQQEVANRRREQSAQDGHNAQFCAPLFEKARETTQKLRGAGASLTKADKQDAQMVAETLWRDALAQCRGPAVQEIAANNANALARERGTPWVPRLAPVMTSGSALTIQMPGAAVADATPPNPPQQAVAPAAGHVLAAPMPPAGENVATLPALRVTQAAQASAPKETTSTQAAPEPTAQQPGDVMAGDTRYMGQFYRDANATTVSGQGKVSWASGGMFEGALVQGKRQGQGTMTWANGQRYVGEWVQDKPQGQGKLHFANGNDYEGTVTNGIPQGVGHMRYASGDTFDGIFNNGEPEQSGVYVWRNGQRYEGAWQGGRPEGQGKLQFSSGNRYEGAVVGGVPQGQGRMVYATGEVYEGEFSNGQPHGQGTFTWTQGDRYVGQWAGGKKHGNGVFTWASGERWEGVYDQDIQKN